MEEEGLRSISGVDASAGPLNGVSEAGFVPAKVPRRQNLQQVKPASFLIKHQWSVVEQADWVKESLLQRMQQKKKKMQAYVL